MSRKEDEGEESPKSRRAEAVLVYIVVWVGLAVPGSAILSDLLYSPSWILRSYDVGLSADIIWIFVATLFIAPYFTARLMDRLYPGEVPSSPPIRQRVKAFFGDIWEFLTDISHFFRTIFLAWHVAFLLPAGILVAIGLGGWFYLLPFVVANILVSYKLNKARTTRGVESYDDKHFTGYEKSLNDYVSLVKRSKEQEGRPENK